MKRINFAIVFVAAGLIIQLFWEVWLWSGVITHPLTSRPTDFSIFYTAGRLADAGQYGQLYDIQAQLRVQEPLVGRSLQPDELLPFNHPPLLVPFLQLVCSPDYLASYWRWTLVMILFLAGTAFVMGACLRLVKAGRGARLLLLVAALSFYPVFAGLLKGQDTAFLLFGGMLWLYGLLAEKDSLAGLGLALTVIRPQIALVLAVPFLFNRRRVWWAFCGGAAVLAAYSLALVGFRGVRDFVHLLQVSAAGLGFRMNQEGMFNFTGAMLRLFPNASVDLVHGLAWGLFVAAIVGLSVLWKVSPEIHLRHLVLAACLALFVAPHLHYHDLAFLLVPIFGLVLILCRRGRVSGSRRPALLPVAASLAFLVSDWWDPLRFSFPYLLMAALPFLAWRMEGSHEAH